MMKENDISKTPKKCIVKEGIFLVACFALPVVILVVTLANMGITYGGPLTLLVYDMRQQFMPFYASLRYVLEGEYSLFFTGGASLGSNFWGILIYYMASPLSWLTVLFDLKHLPDAIYLITLIKAGLCGVTFALFTRFGLSPQRKLGFSHVVFSCCYALMSYTLVYSMSPMWIDGVIMFPLVLLGVEKLMEGKKGLVYLASISATFICSYYISYMIGIFTAAYIVCRVLCTVNKENWKKMFQILVRFAICTILALSMAMPILYPALRSIAAGKGVGESASLDRPETGYNFTVFELLQKLLPMQYDSIENQGLPSIYCGTLMYVLVIVFLLQKKHGLKKKIMAVVLMALPTLGFLFEKIDLAWHIFQYPHSYPYRYAFIFSMVVLVFAWYAYEELPKDKDFYRLLLGIAGCYLCVELFLNAGWIFTSINKEANYSVRSEYDITVGMVEPLVHTIKEDDSFYRTEIVSGYTMYNEALMYGLNGVSGFTSTYNKNVNMLIGVFGGLQFSICSSGRELTPLGDSLFGVKYRISLEEYLPGYEVKDETEYSNEIGSKKMYLHENKNALPIAYMINCESVENELVLDDNSFKNQNVFARMLSNEDIMVFQEIEYERQEEGEYLILTMEALSDNPVYMYIDGEKEMYIYEDGVRVFDGARFEVDVEWGEEHNRIYAESLSNIYVGAFTKGEKVTVKIEKDYLTVKNLYLAEMDMEVYEHFMTKLQEGQLELTNYKGDNYTGRVVAKENQVLLTTLPCQEGIKLKIDGEESPYSVAWGALLAVPLTPGEHLIEISYVAPGFELGMVLCILGLVLSSLYLVNKGDFYQKMLHKS